MSHTMLHKAIQGGERSIAVLAFNKNGRWSFLWWGRLHISYASYCLPPLFLFFLLSPGIQHQVNISVHLLFIICPRPIVPIQALRSSQLLSYNVSTVLTFGILIGVDRSAFAGPCKKMS